MDYLNQLFNGVIQYVLTGVFAGLCIFLGVKLRQAKNKKAAQAEE